MTDGEIAAAIRAKFLAAEAALNDIDTLATPAFRNNLPPIRRAVAEAMLASAQGALALAHRSAHRCSQESGDPEVQSGGGSGK